MTFFNSLLQKLNNWSLDDSKILNVSGLNSTHWTFLLHDFSQSDSTFIKDNTHIIVCPNVDYAEEIYSDIKKVFPPSYVHLFPGMETSPYTGIISSEINLFKRFEILDRLAQVSTPSIIVTTFEGVLLKVPPLDFFQRNSFSLEVSDIISPLELSKKLVDLGYSASTTVEEPGTFSSKGEIFDIFPISHPPIRIHYFDDMIENVNPIDLSTQKTERSRSFAKVRIAVSPKIFSNDQFRDTLRKNIPVSSPTHKRRFEYRKEIFSSLSNNILFENYPNFVPLFFEEGQIQPFIEYLGQSNLIMTLIEGINISYSISELAEQLHIEHERETKDVESTLLLPDPQFYYNFELLNNLSSIKTIEVNHLEVVADFNKDIESTISLKLEAAGNFLKSHIQRRENKFEFIKGIFSFLKEHFRKEGRIIFASNNNNSISEIKYLLESNDFPRDLLNRISFHKMHLKEGFYYHQENVLVISDNDIFIDKKRKAGSTPKKKVDLFAEQLSTLKKGDFITHNEFGIGEYQGLESLDIGGAPADYMVIVYADGDKVYVPVYKMNLVSKHADATAQLGLANLKNNKFSKLKISAKKSVKKLAFDLLQLQAERQSSSSFVFSPPDHLYKEFELAFPFTETHDQLNAINSVIEDMQKAIPMDHLVCGDVGFGKTEVAMRAAFKAVLDKKQVAILVPTTILALQHFNSFLERFKEFPVKIEYLSRFKTTKQISQIKEGLIGGKIDIVIGTHKLLGSSIRYKDLGLVIIDEEQRFGVAHKEKLKLLKSSVDFLTLTATPIPRTLQLAFLGIRELSLIQTSPPKRQSIKSYLVKEDHHTIKMAIENELNRGGQVFYVHNRVQELDKYHAKIMELVPNAKIVVAHGQMNKKELESRITAFFRGEYQILLCTTIIESGIDIPNANTLIVSRADTFGLAQLHQLRGRIGRSDKKAYAYFIVPKTEKLTMDAESRLKALQTYSEIGQGFALASCDLEIRGAGDILGASQSGHIEQIGLELYMELLKEAIHELKGEKKLIRPDVEINTPFPAFIPAHFISDSSERLKTYKKLSNCDSFERLSELKEELNDIFGTFPQELRNLLVLLEVRIHLQNCGIKTVQVAGTIIHLKFDKNILEQNPELRDKVVEIFLSKSKRYNFTPNYEVIYTGKKIVDLEGLLVFSQEIAKQIVPH